MFLRKKPDSTQNQNEIRLSASSPSEADLNVNYLEMILNEHAIWNHHAYFGNLPDGFTEIKNILIEEVTSDIKLEEIKEIADFHLNEKLLFGLFDKPINPLVKEFFNAIINNTLKSFYGHFEIALRAFNNKDCLNNAKHWG